MRATEKQVRYIRHLVARDEVRASRVSRELFDLDCTEDADGLNAGVAKFAYMPRAKASQFIAALKA